MQVEEKIHSDPHTDLLLLIQLPSVKCHCGAMTNASDIPMYVSIFGTEGALRKVPTLSTKDTQLRLIKVHTLGTEVKLLH